MVTEVKPCCKHEAIEQNNCYICNLAHAFIFRITENSRNVNTFILKIRSTTTKNLQHYFSAQKLYLIHRNCSESVKIEQYINIPSTSSVTSQLIYCLIYEYYSSGLFKFHKDSMAIFRVKKNHGFAMCTYFWLFTQYSNLFFLQFCHSCFYVINLMKEKYSLHKLTH